jgi:PAS domain S-box-containing protein
VYNLLGLPFSEENVENLDLFEFVHPDDIRRINSQIKFAYDNKTKFDETHRIIDHQGKEKTIHTTGHFVNENPNELFIGSIQDVSDLYFLKKQVVIEETKLRILAENSTVGILMANGQEVLFVNQALLYLSGVCSLEEFKNINPIDLVHPADRVSFLNLTNNLLNKNFDASSTHQITLRSHEQNGKVRIFDVCITACLMDGSKYFQILVVDISDEIEKGKMMSQLASDSLYICQKNKIIGQVKKELNEILKNKCLKFSKEKYFKNILDVLNVYSKNDTDWGIFNKHFDNLHPGFVTNLKMICPLLTVNEIKHCACIRLNLDTKETARFFNVTPATIQTARVRLKKKLDLPKSIDLRYFIESI